MKPTIIHIVDTQRSKVPFCRRIAINGMRYIDVALALDNLMMHGRAFGTWPHACRACEKKFVRTPPMNRVTKLVEPLRPCPFCGGTHHSLLAELRDGYEKHRNDPDAFSFAIVCESCAAQGGWAKSSSSGAARWWNLRPLPSPILKTTLVAIARWLTR